MTQQHCLRAQMDQGGLGQNLQVSPFGEVRADQEVPVARHEVDPRAAFRECGQLCRQPTVQGVIMIVVPCPVLVEITQDVECVSIPGWTCEVALEDLSQRGAVDRKMQVGNEMNLHAPIAPW